MPVDAAGITVICHQETKSSFNHVFISYLYIRSAVNQKPGIKTYRFTRFFSNYHPFRFPDIPARNGPAVTGQNG